MNKEDYTIADLKGIAGYQFMQVMYYLLRTSYYTPETNQTGSERIEDYFKHIGNLEGDALETFLTEVSTICGDVSDDYWKIIMKNVLYKGDKVIPESISTIPAEILVYILREGLKKVLAIKLPF